MIAIPLIIIMFPTTELRFVATGLNLCYISWKSIILKLSANKDEGIKLKIGTTIYCLMSTPKLQSEPRICMNTYIHSYIVTW